jgi:hypothetical protein
MPQYKVMAEGFYDGVLRKPGCPRHGIVTTDKPIDKKKLPSWLKPMASEQTARQKAAAKKAATDVAAKVADDKKEVDGARVEPDFTGSKVETI